MPKITVTVDDETYERLQTEAKDQDRTVTAQARRILRHWAESGAREHSQLKIEIPNTESVPKPPWGITSRPPYTGKGDAVPYFDRPTPPESLKPVGDPEAWTPRPGNERRWATESMADHAGARPFVPEVVEGQEPLDPGL